MRSKDRWTLGSGWSVLEFLNSTESHHLFLQPLVLCTLLFKSSLFLLRCLHELVDQQIIVNGSRCLSSRAVRHLACKEDYGAQL